MGFIIFLSYSRKDSTKYKISRIVDKLKSNSMIDEVLYYEGEEYSNIYKFMNDNIKKCDILITFCSQNATNSKYVELEWQAALSSNKKVIPVFIEEKYIPPLLAPFLGVYFNKKEFDDTIQDILNTIKKVLGSKTKNKIKEGVLNQRNVKENIRTSNIEEMSDRKKLNVLLRWYKQEVGDNLVAVIVVTRDGLVIDSVIGSNNELDEEIVGSVSALVEPVLDRITREFSLGTFGNGTFDTEEYRFIFCEAGPEAVFVTILDAIAPIDPVFPYAYMAAEKVSRIFDGRTVSPVIPKIIFRSVGQQIERKIYELQQLKTRSPEYCYKLILGGDGAVGKTSMVHRFVEDSFQTDYKSTIGTSIMKKQFDFEGIKSRVRFVIWDLAGQSQFKRVRQSYLANAEAGILVYDVSRKETIENIKNWYKEIKEITPDISMILVGNKIDLEREVSTDDGEALANELKVSYIETSAKTGENITDAFKMLALQMINKFLIADWSY